MAEGSKEEENEEVRRCKFLFFFSTQHGLGTSKLPLDIPLEKLSKVNLVRLTPLSFHCHSPLSFTKKYILKVLCHESHVFLCLA